MKNESAAAPIPGLRLFLFNRYGLTPKSTVDDIPTLSQPCESSVYLASFPEINRLIFKHNGLLALIAAAIIKPFEREPKTGLWNLLSAHQAIDST